MNGLAAVCGLTLLALVLTITLKKDAPVIAFLLAVTAGVLLLAQVYSELAGAVRQISALLEQGGMTSGLYLPVVRAVGVAVIVRVVSALCRDAGQSALAAQVEIAGAVLTLAICLPLLEQVVELAAGWMC